MIKIYSHEKLALFFLSALMAIAGIYSYKMASFLLPVVTFLILYFEGGIKNISLQRSPPLVIFAFLLFWIGMSVFWAENQVAALKTFIALVITLISALFYFDCLMKATPGLISKAYTIIKVAGFFLICLIMFQICADTFFEGVILSKRGVPYMLEIKPTASVLGLAAFVSCAFLWTYGNKAISVALFFIIFCLIHLTTCQTAIYGFSLATIVFCLSYFMPSWITRLGMISSYTFLLLSPLIYAYILPVSEVLKSSYLQAVVNGSMFHRWLAWDYYSKKFFEKPFSGWGVESSRYIPTEREFAPGYEVTLHPHNSSVQAYVELGLIGGVLYALFFSSLFYMVEKHVKDRVSIAVCNATITFGLVMAEFTHSAWRNYWLSLAVLTAGLIILSIKAREAQQHESAGHLGQPLAL